MLFPFWRMPLPSLGMLLPSLGLLLPSLGMLFPWGRLLPLVFLPNTDRLPWSFWVLILLRRLCLPFVLLPPPLAVFLLPPPLGG